jgi:Uma2 family endonuclease
MNSLMERPSIRQNLYPIAVATYHALGELNLLDEKVELLRGMLVSKMPKSELHVHVVRRLLKLLADEAAKRGLELLKEDPLTLVDSEPEPDLALVPALTMELDQPRPHPTTALLVIEVAVTTYERDRAKADIYAEAGVPEYWIVRPVERMVEVFSKPSADGYRESVEVGEDEVLNPSALPGCSVTVSALFPNAR